MCVAMAVPHSIIHISGLAGTYASSRKSVPCTRKAHEMWAMAVVIPCLSLSSHDGCDA